MKKIYLMVVGLLIVGITQAQVKDSVVVKEKKSKTLIIDSEGVKVTIDSDEGTDTTIIKKKKTVKYPLMTFGLTFEHFDIGLSQYHTGSDFGTPTGYDYLETNTWKTSNVGFDFAQMGIRFNPSFKIMLAAGLDWNHMRLKQNVTIQPDQPILTKEDDAIQYDKNRFSSRYLRIPLYFEYRTPQNEKGKRASIVLGPEVGFLINGKVKQVSKENGKVKEKDDYNFEPFRYGANVRIGYGGAGLFFKYYMNDVFAKGEGPAEYKNMNFGLTFGF